MTRRKRGVPSQRRVPSRDDAQHGRVHRASRHYVPQWKTEQAAEAEVVAEPPIDLLRHLERAPEPLFTAADDKRLLHIVNRALDFVDCSSDAKERALAERCERDAYAVECLYNGGDANQAVYLLEDMGLLHLARWFRDGMPVDRRRRAPHHRSKARQAAQELPAIQRILREHCGDGSRERAIRIALLRYPDLKPKTLKNHLRSRHHPQRFKKRGR